MPRTPEVVRRRPNRTKLDAIGERFAALGEAAREEALRGVDEMAAKRFVDKQVKLALTAQFTGGDSARVGLSVGNVHFLPGALRKSTSQEIHAVRRAETRRGRPARTP